MENKSKNEPYTKIEDAQNSAYALVKYTDGSYGYVDNQGKPVQFAKVRLKDGKWVFVDEKGNIYPIPATADTKEDSITKQNNPTEKSDKTTTKSDDELVDPNDVFGL